jgi:hypothetical protein
MMRFRLMPAVRAPIIAIVIQTRFHTLNGTGAASIPA